MVSEEAVKPVMSRHWPRSVPLVNRMRQPFHQSLSAWAKAASTIVVVVPESAVPLWIERSSVVTSAWNLAAVNASEAMLVAVMTPAARPLTVVTPVAVVVVVTRSTKAIAPALVLISPVPVPSLTVTIG